MTNKTNESKILSFVNVPLIIAFAIYQAWVATKLWLWFAVPQFEVKPISLGVMYGLGMMIGVIRHRFHKIDDSSEEVFGKVLAGFFSLTFALVVGKLIH